MTISQAMLWCIFVALSTLDVANAASFRCYNASINDYTSTPIDQPLGIASCLSKFNETIVHAQGFNYKNSGPETIAIIQAYIRQLKKNVVLVDYEKEAQGGLPFGAGYGVAATLALKIGVQVGKSLVELQKNGTIRLNSTWLSGFSLGAHLMGRAGEEVQKNNYNVERIYGYEPARLLFDDPGLEGLKRTQAPVVIVLHTNCGKYGSAQSDGTIDFWANCAPCTIAGQQQPGCPGGLQIPLSDNDLCSHKRSIYYAIESLTVSFPAAYANSCSEWKNQNSPNVITNNFGYDIDTSKQGNFYFSTNSQSPYSKGQAGLTPNT